MSQLHTNIRQFICVRFRLDLFHLFTPIKHYDLSTVSFPHAYVSDPNTCLHRNQPVTLWVWDNPIPRHHSRSCFPHCMCIQVTHKHPGNEANYLHYSLSCQWNHDHYSFITNLKKTQKDFLRSLSERFSFVQHHLTLG